MLLFRGITLLASCYQIALSAFKLSWSSLPLVLLGGLAGGTIKAERTVVLLVLCSVAACLTPACNKEMTNVDGEWEISVVISCLLLP